MKITFPRERRKISGKGNDDLYVVVCRFNNGDWGFADFWNLPYTSKSYQVAKTFQKKIDAWAKDHNWKNNSTAIMHIKF